MKRSVTYSMKIGKRWSAALAGALLVPVLALAEPDVPEQSYAQDEAVSGTLLTEPEGAPEEAPEPPEGESAEGTPDLDVEPVLVRSLSVSLSSGVLFPGGNLAARCHVSPEGASQDIEWSSSMEAVRVDASGMVRAASRLKLPDEGLDVDIWAHATDGSLVMNCATVRLMPAATLLRFFEETLELNADQDERSARVTVELAPAALYGITPIEWSSSDPDVARVEGTGMRGEIGLIRWTGARGSAVIVARAADGSGVQDALTVNVG
ncbi:MAG: hypothetical protein VB115_05325 [Christensenellaceae bacterium]|nr:hypothetical protein [Christensenellaceae bacterium]